jgi:hypothetical protein
MHPRRSPLGIFLSVLILVVVSAAANAQSQPVPLVTDKTPLALSERFGYPSDDAINQAGDFVFVATWARHFPAAARHPRAGPPPADG